MTHLNQQLADHINRSKTSHQFDKMRSRRNADTTDLSYIRAAAKKFIERFGMDAKNQAIIRANELLWAGDYQGRTRWQLIRNEVEKLLEKDKTLEKST